MDHDFYHEEDGRIEYHEENGKLWYSYQEEEHYQGGHRIYEAKGIVSPKIITKGPEAVKKHVERKVAKAIRQQKKRIEEHNKFAKNPNVLVEKQHGGVLLKGRITYADHRLLAVRLEEPSQGHASINFGFGSAVAGRYIYDDHLSLSGTAIETAQKLLIRIYKEEDHKAKHKDVIELKDRLNEEVD